MPFTNTLFRFEESITSDDYVIATYYLETPMNLNEAANALAAEQTTGTWKRVGEETDEVRARHAAKVVGLYPLPYEVTKGNLPTGMDLANFLPEASASPTINAAIIRLAFPHINFGPKIPNLLTAVAGNLYEMGAFTAIKLLDLQFPDSFLKQFRGPRFGIKGSQDVVGVYDRPLVGAIIKPCVGIDVDTLAKLAYEGAVGGLDFIKDDELIADPDYNRISERVKKVMTALKQAEDETGEKTMYAFNITDRVDRIRELYDIVIGSGGNCVMINVATAGYSAMRVLSDYTEVPIHCHRDFAPCYTRSPYLGISMAAFTKLCRLAGADQLHCGAIQGKLYESDDEVMTNMTACRMELPHIQPCLPVSSGGQWAGKVPVNLRKIGHTNFLHLSGGGIFAHPDGPSAGAKSVRLAWEASLKGVKLEEAAKEHQELQRAIEFYGRVIY